LGGRGAKANQKGKRDAHDWKIGVLRTELKNLKKRGQKAERVFLWWVFAQFGLCAETTENH